MAASSGWEAAARLDHLAQASMQTLHGIGGVDHLADGRREGEERHDVVPVPPPGLTDGRIPPSPFGLEVVEPGARQILGLGAINGANPWHDRLAILPAGEGERIADQMDDAGLDRRFWEDGGDRFGKTLQAIDYGDQDVADAAGLQLVHHLQPEFGAFALLDPKPEHVLLAIDIESERDIDSLVADQAVVADFHPE